MKPPGTYRNLPAPFRPSQTFLDRLCLQVCQTHGSLAMPYRKLALAGETCGTCGACGRCNTIINKAHGPNLPKTLHFIVCLTCQAIQPLQHWPELVKPSGELPKCPPSRPCPPTK